MPFGSQSSSTDGESRYGDLLHPCNDITKNWEINISDLLKEYLQELANINVDVHNGEVTLNFAEAALLIQGSTAIFGKKVEYLYNLASQLLLQLHNEKEQAQAAATATKTKDTSLLVPGVSEFVELDDMTKCNNLNLNEDSNNKKTAVQKTPMVPLALIPLDSNEKGNTMLFNTKGEDLGNKRDYQLNLCGIHSSGCLLLPATHYDFSPDKLPCDMEVYDMDADESDAEDMSPIDAFAPDDDEEQHITNKIASVSDPLPSTDTSEQVPPSAIGESVIFDESEKTELNGVQRRRSMRQIAKIQKELEEKQRKEQELNKCSWNVNGDLQPELKKQIQKKVVRRLPKKLVKKRVSKKKDADIKEKSALLFCSQNFFGLESPNTKKMAAGSKLSINSVFEQLAVEQYMKQKSSLQTCRKKLKLEENIEVKEEPTELKQDTDDVVDDDLGAAPLPDDDDDDDTPATEACGHSESENSGNLCPEAISGDGSLFTYEDLVREHVENYMKDVAQFCQTTELSEKVNQWEERIKPILDNEDQREKFNIHIYGTRIIDKFADNNRKQTLTFNDVCKGKKKWEVCRYFLASLQLANNSNVEIDTSLNANGTHHIELTLLSRKRHQDQLDEFGKGGEH